MVNQATKIVTDKEEPLKDIIPLVMMEIQTHLLAEATQLLNFNEELGACNVSETKAVPRSEEAVQILEEATLAAENTLRARFPSIPKLPPLRLAVTG